MEITTKDARWVRRELRRACKALGIPGLAKYIQVEFPTRMRDRDPRVVGLATSGPYVVYVGKPRKLQPSIVWATPQPFRIHILKRWWLKAHPDRRRYVLYHELTHLIEGLRGRDPSYHGKHFGRTLNEIKRKVWRQWN